ncbi:MAG: hypothetical protein M3N19_05025, partial [Candidatus Eremiobacteraeota bacterium]|nr:hypothetical protein [Candidatus Eremiobacteraeota bacterium]
VWANGRAKVLSQGTVRDANIAPSLATAFFKDLKKAKASGGRSEPCMKSASFGSRTIILYHGWTSGDVSCPGQGAMAALAADVTAITTALGPAHFGRRIQLPANEPRRIPSEGSPAPAPTSTP